MPQIGVGGRPRIRLDKLASEIDKARRRYDLSLRDVARVLNLSPATLTRIRQGHRPDADALAVLLAWLGLPVSEILGASDARLRSEPSGRAGRRGRPTRGRVQPQVPIQKR